MNKAVKKYKNYLKHLLIYLISFTINYLIFIFLMLIVNRINGISMYIIDLIAWIFSMLFIFYIDKKYVPDLVDENNSNELFKFILVRGLSLILEVLILFIFVNILRYSYFSVKLISLILLFLLNRFYVKHFKFKE